MYRSVLRWQAWQKCHCTLSFLPYGGVACPGLRFPLRGRGRALTHTRCCVNVDIDAKALD